MPGSVAGGLVAVDAKASEAVLAVVLGENVRLGEDSARLVGGNARLVWASALDSRRHAEVIASLRTFTGYLIVEGYLAYQNRPTLPATAATAPWTPRSWPPCASGTTRP